MSTSLALSFRDVHFDVVDHNGQPWLRLHQIEGALGYAGTGRALSLVYQRNADEFTDTMTALVGLETNGGKQQVRIFSLRGCHLLAMLARTKVAKEFRKWLLDLLDREVATPEVRQRTTMTFFPFEHTDIRILTIDDDPWFVAVDVAGILGYSDERKKAIEKLIAHVPGKWAGLKRIPTPERFREVCTLNIPFGDQYSWCLSEAGLRFFLEGSDKPKAKAVLDWAFNVALPEIRENLRPTLSAEQRGAIRSLIHQISLSCHFQGGADHAAKERIRFAFGLRGIDELRPEHFEDAKADLEGVKALAAQHFERMVALDREFIAAVIRPPVSIRKVRAMVRRQTSQIGYSPQP